MSKYVFEILEEVGKQRNRDDKVKILRDNESWALKDIIRGTMDSTVNWNLLKENHHILLQHHTTTQQIL